MWRIQPTQINHVSLRVRDLQRSAAFYCQLLGLELRPAVPPGDSACLCAVPAASSSVSFGIALMQGLPHGAEPVGLDHISFAVPTADDVDDLYAAALARGVPATAPRLYAGFYQTFLFDPDGYKIEVLAEQVYPVSAVMQAAAASVEWRPPTNGILHEHARRNGDTVLATSVDERP